MEDVVYPNCMWNAWFVNHLIDADTYHVQPWLIVIQHFWQCCNLGLPGWQPEHIAYLEIILFAVGSVCLMSSSPLHDLMEWVWSLFYVSCESVKFDLWFQDRLWSCGLRLYHLMVVVIHPKQIHCCRCVYCIIACKFCCQQKFNQIVLLIVAECPENMLHCLILVVYLSVCLQIDCCWEQMVSNWVRTYVGPKQVWKLFPVISNYAEWNDALRHNLWAKLLWQFQQAGIFRHRKYIAISVSHSIELKIPV